MKFICETCTALAYLHDNSVMHRDIKPMNALLFSQGDLPLLKLSDFGTAKLLQSQVSGVLTNVGTPYYRAPEVGRHPYDRSADIFSLGMASSGWHCQRAEKSNTRFFS